MKNKKGFTLTELIGVIVLLGIIALISVPILNKVIQNSKQKAYDAQVKEIISSAKKWGTEHDSELPKINKNYKAITLKELVKDGYLEDDKLLDPRDNKDLVEAGYCVNIRYNSKKYSYEFNESCMIEPPKFKELDYIYAQYYKFKDYLDFYASIDIKKWDDIVVSDDSKLTFEIEYKKDDKYNKLDCSYNEENGMTCNLNGEKNIADVKITVFDSYGQSNSIILDTYKIG